MFQGRRTGRRATYVQLGLAGVVPSSPNDPAGPPGPLLDGGPFPHRTGGQDGGRCWERRVITGELVHTLPGHVDHRGDLCNADEMVSHNRSLLDS